VADKIALQRFGTPAEVAAMAVAVLSERFGAYVTGATIASTAASRCITDRA
jgi:NAD(P)-dependent dehydrogenase (short-subunit alcohol dehydrogenase family)